MTQKNRTQMIDINLLSRFIKSQGLNKNLTLYIEDHPNKLMNLINNNDLSPAGYEAVDYLMKRKVQMDEATLAVLQLSQIIAQCFKDAPKNGEKKFVLGQRFF